MNSALNVMMSTPVGIAATAVIFGTIVAAAGIATWLIVKSRTPASKEA